MTRTVVDTSAVLALLYPDDDHNRRASNRVHEAAQKGALRINPIVYAELAADQFFSSPEELDAFLNDTGIILEELPREAVFVAGESFQRYLQRRGDELQCPSCGDANVYDCPSCGESITARQHIAAGFLIGAHAERADALLTFDQGFFRDYFDVDCIEIQSSLE